MINKLKSSFAPKSVASVLANFNRAIEELGEVARGNEAEAVRHAQAVVEAQASHEAAIQEAALAREVQSSLMNIITPKISAMGSGALVDSANNVVGIHGY